MLDTSARRREAQQRRASTPCGADRVNIDQTTVERQPSTVPVTIGFRFWRQLCSQLRWGSKLRCGRACAFARRTHNPTTSLIDWFSPTKFAKKTWKIHSYIPSNNFL